MQVEIKIEGGKEAIGHGEEEYTVLLNVGVQDYG